MGLMKKVCIALLSLLFLNGCVQSTAMVGPTLTLVSTGSIYQAGMTLGANKAVENETGMTTSQLVSNTLNDQKNSKNNLDESLVILLDLNIYKTRKKLFNNKEN